MLQKNKHVYFQKEDFTTEEIARENILAVAVLKHKEKICKYCGSGPEVGEFCLTKQERINKGTK